ncbi:methylphosphotriester-DNA--protein-cysteine methyltransferase [Catenulispora sp. GP43]
MITTGPYTLFGPAGSPLRSLDKASWGGHRRSKIYGRLDCPSALRAIAAGGYVAWRVFFADEATAVAAGYRPCAVCCPERYQAWKTAREEDIAWTP